MGAPSGLPLVPVNNQVGASGIKWSEWDQVGSGGIRWDQVGSGGIRWDQVGSSGIKWDQVGSGGIRWDQVNRAHRIQ
jgi:hypothetical protein